MMISIFYSYIDFFYLNDAMAFVFESYSEKPP